MQIVGRHDIGLLMTDYAEKEGVLCQPRKILISRYLLGNGTLITLLLLFYIDLGLECKKISSLRELYSSRMYQ